MFHILEMPFVILHEAIAPWVNRINRHRVNWSTPFARWDSSGVNPKPGLARYRFFGLRRPRTTFLGQEGPAERPKAPGTTPTEPFRILFRP